MTTLYCPLRFAGNIVCSFTHCVASVVEIASASSNLNKLWRSSWLENVLDLAKAVIDYLLRGKEKRGTLSAFELLNIGSLHSLTQAVQKLRRVSISFDKVRPCSLTKPSI